MLADRRERKEEREAVAVAVVASSPVLRAGLRTLLGEIEGVEVVADLTDLGEVEGMTGQARVLVAAPDPAGSEDLVGMLDDRPGVALLLLVEDLDQVGVLGDFPGVWGVLPLEASSEELAAALHALSEGLLVGAPQLVKPALLSPPERPRPDEERLIEPLTERETEVLQLLAQGLANKQIALTLGISEHTVKFHISGVYSKLGATNRTEAVRLGVRKGLVVL
jgi:DNA-binding NarL/FixJ family response regulator